MNLANLVTLGNAAAGLVSIVFSFRGQAAPAAILIYMGMGLDILDGKIARKFNPTQSGKYLDSFSDFVTFGLAPAFLIGNYFSWSLNIWLNLSLGFYVGCCLFRLIRYAKDSKTKTYLFSGLPAPVGAGCLVSFLLIFYYGKMPVPLASSFGLIILISILMTSSILYEHLGHMLSRIKLLYRALFLVLWALCALVGQFCIFTFLMFFIYTVCGFLFQKQTKEKLLKNDC